jgi:hypothetical protein
MTDMEALRMNWGNRHRPLCFVLITIALIGTALLAGSFMLDRPPLPGSDIPSADTTQHSRLPQLHMRF